MYEYPIKTLHDSSLLWLSEKYVNSCVRSWWNEKGILMKSWKGKFISLLSPEKKKKVLFLFFGVFLCVFFLIVWSHLIFTKALWVSQSLNNENVMKQTLNHDVASCQTGNSLMDQWKPTMTSCGQHSLNVLMVLLSLLLSAGNFYTSNLSFTDVCPRENLIAV